MGRWVLLRREESRERPGAAAVEPTVFRVSAGAGRALTGQRPGGCVRVKWTARPEPQPPSMPRSTAPPGIRDAPEGTADHAFPLRAQTPVKQALS